MLHRFRGDYHAAFVIGFAMVTTSRWFSIRRRIGGDHPHGASVTNCSGATGLRRPDAFP